MGCDIHANIQRKYYGRTEWVDYMSLDIKRNYHLFAVLADVRNGYGFAGVETAPKPLPVISEPRGLPDNIDGSKYGDHSYSWLLLKEIVDFDWEQTHEFSGLISPAQQITYLKGTEPAMCIAVVLICLTTNALLGKNH